MPSNTQADPIRVVIIDDSEQFLNAARKLVRSYRNCAFAGQAAGGVSGVELVRKERPDVAIVDYAMPDLNGLQTISSIRIESPETQCLLVSLGGGVALTAAAQQVGSRGYLDKDDLFAELEQAISSAAAATSSDVDFYCSQSVR